MSWKFKVKRNIKAKDSIFIEGLPGIGSVGKIAVDFIIDDLKAEKIIDIQGRGLPGCVFVNEENLVELPKIEIYYKNLKGKSLFFISGDAQPIDENEIYDLCENLLDFCKKYDGNEIITLGGIGLPNIPKNPQIYCTGNNKKLIKRYNVKKIYGLVGPIIGVSGLLVGLAGKRNIPAVSLLAETYGTANHVGLKGAKALLKVLDDRLKLKLDFKRLDKEVKELEREIKTFEKVEKTEEPSVKHFDERDIGYIG